MEEHDIVEQDQGLAALVERRVLLERERVQVLEESERVQELFLLLGREHRGVLSRALGEVIDVLLAG